MGIVTPDDLMQTADKSQRFATTECVGLVTRFLTSLRVLASLRPSAPLR